jgi:transposase
LYRLEDIFQRQGFEISRATQSIWCGDVADLVEPLYDLMADRVRASHVVATDDSIMPMLSTGKTANARMWVYAFSTMCGFIPVLSAPEFTRM